MTAGPRGKGRNGYALACCAGGPGLIPAIGKSNMLYSNGFLSVKGGRKKWSQAQ